MELNRFVNMSLSMLIAICLIAFVIPIITISFIAIILSSITGNERQAFTKVIDYNREFFKHYGIVELLKIGFIVVISTVVCGSLVLLLIARFS